jgi:arylsulfatase A-like enzyme
MPHSQIALTWLKALLFMAFLNCQGPKQEVPTTDKLPNIIYMMADDLGYRELGSYGQKLIRTPQLDKLAEEGVRFTQFYAGSTVCAPSRCTLLTGKHTGHSFVRDNYELGDFTDENEGGQLPLPEGSFTMATMLKQKGYQTGVIGKWGLGGPGSTGVPNKQGFDYFYGYLCQKQAHNYYPTHLWENNQWDSLGNEFFMPHQQFEGDPDNPKDYEKYQGQEYAQQAMTRKTIEFIEQNQHQPFFLYLPFTIPHLALQVPDEALAIYKNQFPETPYLGDKSYLPHQYPRAAYAAMITYMDQQIGLVLEKLDELNLTDNTLVIFTSDNGTTFDIGGVDRKFFNSLGELRGHKTNLYEGGIRVPFIARWPNKIPAGAVSHHLCANWDIVPTVAELLAIETPKDLDGISILPSLLGKGDQPQHEFLYWEYHSRGGSQAVRLNKWKAIRSNVGTNNPGSIELYDLESDLAESQDLSEQFPEIVAQVRSIMQRRSTSHVENWNFNGNPL